MVDLADLRLILENGGEAVFGAGEAEGPNRAVRAAEAALTDLRRHLAACRVR
jgi:cell division GTPase FtsZ